MKCEACGAEIEKIVTEFYDVYENVYEEYVPLIDCGIKAISFEVGPDWVGDGLDAEDIPDIISCPKCGKYPLKNMEVQTDTIIRVVCGLDKEEEEE